MRILVIPIAVAAASAACAAGASRAGAPAPICVAGPVEIVAPGVLSTAASEYNPSLSPDGRTLIFARAERGFERARIYVSQWSGGAWGEPRPAPFADGRHTDSDPTLSPDGRTLYFISTRPAAGRDTARRDLDVWRVERRRDGWGEPEHLGPEVNSSAQELGPVMHGGHLYFGSTRGGRATMLDLYRARAVPGGFAAAESLGPAVNSPSSEGDPELSADGGTLLFWSDRAGGAGSADLYASRRTAEGWSAPERLAGVSSPAFDFTPSFSPDGRWLYFASTRNEAPGAPAAVLNGESNIYRVRLGRGGECRAAG